MKSWKDLNREVLDFVKSENTYLYDDSELGFRRFLGFSDKGTGTSRVADYYLDYLDARVFLDFCKNRFGEIYLVRISFDGYGCCRVVDGEQKTLSFTDSLMFVHLISEHPINNDKLYPLVKKLIDINREVLWKDALKEYGL
ncbi:TPA: hypothetical protein U1325_000102 [Streptococcus suis]|nr:hypothetical protein [Streptococcus suis]HEM5005097.1 hypothetical protein [Streptococcus suis]HEM5189336.1 hypothetical protein [Streptococcus suis]HEM5210383.1 hypothetical protein [Streptococcus suis]HEM5332975.1 hypothetical protein [Streptococcus suis]